MKVTTSIRQIKYQNGLHPMIRPMTILTLLTLTLYSLFRQNYCVEMLWNNILETS